MGSDRPWQSDGPPCGRPKTQCVLVEPVGSTNHPIRTNMMRRSFLRVGLCPNRLKGIRPSLAQRGTALRASHEAVLRGRTSGFRSTSSSPIESVSQAIICSTRQNIEGGIVTGSLYGDPVIPRLLAEGPPCVRPKTQCVLVEPVGSNLHPRRQLKMPHKRSFARPARILRVGL